MKIEGPRSTVPAGPARKSAGAAAPGFAVPAASAGTSAPISEAAPAALLTSLMALQVHDYDPNRKNRQVKRGKATLEALDALLRATLFGEAPHGARLMLVKLQGEIEMTGDPRLDAILAEIDVRAAVELAKLDMAEPPRG
jgi:hypothetical protein